MLLNAIKLKTMGMLLLAFGFLFLFNFLTRVIGKFDGYSMPGIIIACTKNTGFFSCRIFNAHIEV